MNHPILSFAELWALWEKSEIVFPSVAPKDRYAATFRLVVEMFPGERGHAEIANRFYGLLRCIDSSGSEIDDIGRSSYDSERFHVNREIIRKLWDYFGDPTRIIDPRNVVRACEII